MLRLICILLFALAVNAQPRWHELDGYTFDRYSKDFNKVYDSRELSFRQSLFENNLRIIQEHNSGDFTWKKGVNQFTDWTDEERQALNGVNRGMLYSEERVSPGYEMPKVDNLASSVDWRGKGILTAVKDQGRCGSCWTFGTTETIEAYQALKYNKLPNLSEQQILDCTPNTDDCGGTGGCEGGTAVLAINKLKDLGGQTSEWMYPYVSYWGQDQPQCLFNASKTTPYAKLKGYVRLPYNEEAPMMAHLQNGPLIINVDASTWFDYESGIYDGCNQTNPTIDHVVQLVGYGSDSTGDYWIIRNSWAPIWGENGFMRLRRTAEPRCGVDLNPSVGVGCKNGPPTERVCGTCGIAFHVVMPVVE